MSGHSPPLGNRLQAWRMQLAMASDQAARGQFPLAHTTYENVRAEIRASGAVDALSKIVEAEAVSGLAWVARQQVTGDSPKLWQEARNVATKAVEGAQDERDPSSVAHALFVRARARIELTEPVEAFDDLAAAEAALRDPRAIGDRDGIRARIAIVMKELAEANQRVPARCDLCGVTAGTAEVLLVGLHVAICRDCALEIVRARSQLAPRSGLPCSFCGMRPPKLVAWWRSIICHPCIAGFEWVLETKGEAPDACAYCDGRPGAEKLVSYQSSSMCLACTQSFVGIVDQRLGPRAGRERGGALVRQDVRCTACGKGRVRTCVVGSTGRGICDVCIDQTEARFFAAGLLEAPLSKRKDAAATDAVSADTLEALVEGGRTELLQWLVIGRAGMPNGDYATYAANVGKWLARVEASAHLMDPASLAYTRCAIHHRLGLHDDTPKEIADAERARAAHHARVAIAEGHGMGATRDLVLVLTTDDAKRDPRVRADELGEALGAYVADIAAASPLELAKMYQRLANVHVAADRKRDARNVSYRALALFEHLAENESETARRDLAGALVGVANIDDARAIELLDRAIAIYEGYLDRDRYAVVNFVVAQGNAALAFERAGDLGSVIARLERARDVLIGGMQVYENLADRKLEIDQRLARALVQAERWVDAANVAVEAIDALREQDEDPTEMVDLRRSALRNDAKAEGREVEFCTVCDDVSDNVEAMIRGRRAAICTTCIDDAEPCEEADNTVVRCWFCSVEGPKANGLVFDDTFVCADCVERCEARREEAEEHGSIVWIDPAIGKNACSFCSKEQREVKKLIAGPHCQICDECIGLCNDILAEDATAHAKPKTRTAIRCSFCNKDWTWKLIAGPNVHICDECVQLCNDIIAEEVDKEAPGEETTP